MVHYTIIVPAFHIKSKLEIYLCGHIALLKISPFTMDVELQYVCFYQRIMESNMPFFRVQAQIVFELLVF